jgi:hypothetical protein
LNEKMAPTFTSRVFATCEPARALPNLLRSNAASLPINHQLN